MRGKKQSILSTSNRLTSAEDIWLELAPVLVDQFGGKQLAHIGQKSVTMLDGSRWQVRAASPKLVGGSHDLIVVDEVWNIAPEVIDDALRPSQIARPSPLMSHWSTAGDEGSAVMIDLREQAIRDFDTGEPSGLYFAEWSIPPGVNPRDEKYWGWANPSLGKTITVPALRSLSKKKEFLHQHLNCWVSKAGSWLEDGVWANCETDAAMPAGGILCVDSSVNEARYVGVRSAAADGVAHVAVEFVVETGDVS